MFQPHDSVPSPVLCRLTLSRAQLPSASTVWGMLTVGKGGSAESRLQLSALRDFSHVRRARVCLCRVTSVVGVVCSCLLLPGLLALHEFAASHYCSMGDSLALSFAHVVSALTLRASPCVQLTAERLHTFRALAGEGNPTVIIAQPSLHLFEHWHLRVSDHQSRRDLWGVTWGVTCGA